MMGGYGLSSYPGHSYKVKYFDKYNVCEKYDLSQTFLERLPLAQLNYRDANSNMEIFFQTSTPPPPIEFANAAPPENFIWFGPLQANFAGKTWIYLSGFSIGWMLIQSDSRSYNGRGQGSGSPGEEGGTQWTKKMNQKMNKNAKFWQMNKNAKFWHSLKVTPGCLIFLINLNTGAILWRVGVGR